MTSTSEWPPQSGKWLAEIHSSNYSMSCATMDCWPMTMPFIILVTKSSSSASLSSGVDGEASSQGRKLGHTAWLGFGFDKAVPEQAFSQGLKNSPLNFSNRVSPPTLPSLSDFCNGVGPQVRGGRKRGCPWGKEERTGSKTGGLPCSPGRR